MSVDVTSVTVEGVATLVVEVSDPIEAADHPPGDWSVTLEPGSLGAIPSVTTVEFDEDDNAVLTVYPDLSPGATYRVVLDGASDTAVVATDFAEPPVAAAGRIGKIPVANLLAVIGRQDQKIAGVAATIVRVAWRPGDTRVLVKSTLRFPDSGAFYAGSLRFTYTSRTHGSFEGVVPQYETIEVIGVGAFVTYDERSRVPEDIDFPVDMPYRKPSDPSQLQQAINDTLITRAEHKRFDKLVADYGYRRPYYIRRSGWRRACLASVWGKGASFGCFYDFMEGALSQYAISFTATLSQSNPTRVTASEAIFEEAHEGRLVRIPNVGLYRIETFTSSTVVELLAFRTAYWDKADWTQDIDTATLEVSGCEILAFEVHEPTPDLEEIDIVSPNGIRPGSPGLVRIYMHNDVLSPTPPTYIQPDASARPVGQPQGGQIQANAAEVGDATNGPFPLYLVGTKVLPEVASVAKRMLMAPGYRLEIRRSPLG